MYNITSTPAIGLSTLLFFRAWNKYQVRLLDLSGPPTRILDQAEEARLEGTLVDASNLSNWALRAICFFGECEWSSVTRAASELLLQIDSKLESLASKEMGQEANGLHLGD